MGKLIENWTIGADIEVFLKNKKTGEIVSAEGLIKGTKDEPFNYDQQNKYFATSLDNVLAEFCIPPSNNPVDFYNYIKKSLDYIRNTIPQELTTEAIPSALLDNKWLQTEQARIFGCDPDYCVWTRTCNPKPETIKPNLRSCGGHIHVGYSNPNMDINELLVKALDLFLGVPSVIQEPDNDRKILYGKAGAFRWKDYGIEYRTISNYYLQSEELTKWVYANVNAAIEFVNSGEAEEKLYAYQETIQSAINSNDKRLAKDIVKLFNIKLAA